MAQSVAERFPTAVGVGLKDAPGNGLPIPPALEVGMVSLAVVGKECQGESGDKSVVLSWVIGRRVERDINF